MMASPTAASAAATAMTNNTKIWPLTPSRWASATNVRFTALSISSTHMKITMALRRISTPAKPIVNRTAESARGAEAAKIEQDDDEQKQPHDRAGVDQHL